MTGVPAWLLPHLVTVEPYEGDTAHGPTWGDPVAHPAMVEEIVREVRDAEGRVTVSTATVTAALGVRCPPGSRVTLPSGRVSRVLASAQRDAGALPLPTHTEMRCE